MILHEAVIRKAPLPSSRPSPGSFAHLFKRIENPEFGPVGGCVLDASPLFVDPRFEAAAFDFEDTDVVAVTRIQIFVAFLGQLPLARKPTIPPCGTAAQLAFQALGGYIIFS